MLVKKIIRVLVLVVFNCTSILYAQQKHLFTEFKDIEKLTSNMVNYFYQDSYGFLWIATADGLTSYDGKNVKSYKNLQFLITKHM